MLESTFNIRKKKKRETKALVVVSWNPSGKAILHCHFILCISCLSPFLFIIIIITPFTTIVILLCVIINIRKRCTLCLPTLFQLINVQYFFYLTTQSANIIKKNTLTRNSINYIYLFFLSNLYNVAGFLFLFSSVLWCHKQPNHIVFYFYYVYFFIFPFYLICREDRKNIKAESFYFII